MKYTRILRVGICLLLVFSLLIGVSPFRAEATSLTTAVVVTVAVAPVVVSVLKGLGVIGASAAGSLAFSNLVDSCIVHLQQIGLCQEMTIEVFGYTYKGYSVFGITSSLVEAIRSWLFDQDVLQDKQVDKGYQYLNSTYTPIFTSSILEYLEKYPNAILAHSSQYKWTYLYLTDGTLFYGEDPSFPAFNNSINMTGGTGLVTFSLGSSWTYRSKQDITETSLFSYGPNYKCEILWSNQDIVASSFTFVGSEPILSPTVTTDQELELGVVATPDLGLSEGYSDWSNNSISILDPSTNKEVAVWPIPPMTTYEDSLPLTQQQVWEGTPNSSKPITGTFADTAVGTFIASLVDALLEGLKSLFVPSDGYIDGKVNDLCDEYVFADSIASTAKDLRSFLTSLGSKPPVIHIDLGASTGPYDFGGEMVFIDFSFYDPYKPVMDAILSAFLWLWFVWRVILGLPGIISGMSGLSGANIDASSVGVTSGTGPIVTDDSIPKHTPQPGGDAHFREWLRNRNDAHYNEYHGRIKK